jgi:hypothetical protein
MFLFSGDQTFLAFNAPVFLSERRNLPAILCEAPKRFLHPLVLFKLLRTGDQ